MNYLVLSLIQFHYQLTPGSSAIVHRFHSFLQISFLNSFITPFVMFSQCWRHHSFYESALCADEIVCFANIYIDPFFHYCILIQMSNSLQNHNGFSQQRSPGFGVGLDGHRRRCSQPGRRLAASVPFWDVMSGCCMRGKAIYKPEHPVETLKEVSS